MSALLIGSNIFIVINFLIITLILWTKKGNNLSNKILGLFILLNAVVLIFNFLVYSRLLDPYYYYLCSIPACMIGPLAYLYCKFLLKDIEELGNKVLVHFIPVILMPLFLFVFKNIFMLEKDTNFLFKGDAGFPDSLKFLISCHIAGYYLYTFFQVKKYDKNCRSFSNYELKKIRWVKSFIYSLNVFIIGFFFLHFISVLCFNTVQVGSSFVSPLIALFFYFFILKKAIEYSPVFETKENKPVYPIMSEDTLDELEFKLQEVLKNEKPYTDKELNLKKLSLLINASPKHISLLLNNRYRKNFNDFINGYRVEESKLMLKDPGMSNLKLEAIAEAAGFNSRASFFSIFKKFTGHTPASFRKEL